jgi:hypothetical protein
VEESEVKHALAVRKPILGMTTLDAGGHGWMGYGGSGILEGVGRCFIPPLDDLYLFGRLLK